MKARQTFRSSLLIAVTLLLFGVSEPIAAPSTSNNTSQSCLNKSQVPANTTSKACCKAKTDKVATTAKASQKSILDAEVLESPLSFFKDYSSFEEDEKDNSFQTSALIIVLKALIASLLSTII